MSDLKTDSLTVFPTAIGWMAMIGSGKTLRALCFGYRRQADAVGALSPELVCGARDGQWNKTLMGRLQAYACGSPEDFRDVEIDPGPQSDFRRRVTACCREVLWGSTISYGQLAVRAGFPRAARAVGRCMALNRIPLVVPCHRVVGADGGLHGFSAAGGLSIKKKLLEMESAPVRPDRGCAIIGLE